MKSIVLWMTLLVHWNLIQGQVTGSTNSSTVSPTSDYISSINYTYGDDNIYNLTDSGLVKNLCPNCGGLDLQTAMKGARRTSNGIDFKPSEVIRCLKELAVYVTTPIFPGTDWCGAGDRAKKETDLGKFKKTDMCCRDHDSCTNSIPGHKNKTFQEGGGINTTLTNNTPITLSDCSCDLMFYNCLRDTDSATSNLIGFIYFDLLKMKCIKQDYPPKCRTLFWKHCSRNILNTGGKKAWRIYKNPRY